MCEHLIPLWGRAGVIQAHAIVDADTFERYSEFRWHLGSRGYARRAETIDGKQTAVLLHREILGLTRGDARMGDHINRNRLDNRRKNLRIVTRAENMQNQGSHTGSTSRFRGVYFVPRTSRRREHWRATVRLNGRIHRLGRFRSEGDAGRAAEEFRLAHMPFAEPTL
jgi:hypothetical protein